MKKLNVQDLNKAVPLSFTVSLSNCSVNWRTNRATHSYKAKKLPPGHAKKLNGDKSAKYAQDNKKRPIQIELVFLFILFCILTFMKAFC
jgi:hypothetical protein